MNNILSKIFAFFLAAIAAITGLFHAPAQPVHDLTVELSANPTTGCSWEVKMDKEGIVKLVSSEYKSSQSKSDEGLVGVGGTQTFCFEAVKDGQVIITFQYGHKWDGEVYRTVIYNVLSKDGEISVLSTVDTNK